MTIPADCPICRGRQYIRLPFMRPLSVTAAVSTDEMVASTEIPFRDYPCPECGPKINIERIQILEFHTLVSNEIDDPAFHAHAKREAAFRLVDELIDKDFITIRKGPDDRFEMRYELIATLGVVSKSVVATLKQRIKQNQEDFAKEVVKKAHHLIDNWGSYYGHRSLSKEAAHREINDAFQQISEERA